MTPRSLSDGAADDLVPAALKVVLHEIRQPLAAVFALADQARNRSDVPADVRRQLEQIIEQAQEISAVAASVLETGADQDDGSPVDVDEVVDSVVSAFGHTWTGTFVRRGGRGSAGVVGGRVRVRRCLVNVVDNAARAAGAQGTVTIAVHHGADVVRILVEDDGPGFGHGPRGSGLGLSVTRGELEVIGGSVAVGLPSRSGGGCVALSLPVASDGPRYGDGPGRVG